MFNLLINIYWKLSGWKLKGSFPHQYKKLILAVGPHTHWQDVLIGFAGRHKLKIPHAHFIGKKELFKGVQGWILKRLGGLPVDRFSKLGMVDQVVEMYNTHEHFIIGIAPEGTRKKVDKLRSGFYHIAHKAGIPIVPIGLDFQNKELVVGDPIFTGENEETVIKKIISFYADIKGKVPGKDLRHLK